MGSGTSRQVITPVRTENEELASELSKMKQPESKSIFAFNLEAKIVPETTFRFKSPNELVKFSENKDKKQEKSLDAMKSLKEEVAEYDEKPTLLELKINSYAKELFGEDEEEDSKKSKPDDANLSLVDEMEKLIDPNKQNKSGSNIKTKN